MPTGNLKIDALLPKNEPKWQNTNPANLPVNVTYSFLTQVTDDYKSDAGERKNFMALNDVQKQSARQALKLWGEVANIKFTEVNDGSEGQIRFGTADLGTDSSAHAYYPGTGIGGDVWLNNSKKSNLDQTPGSFGFLTMIHELGHALGLEHPGNYNAGGGGTDEPYLPEEEDTNQYTVMSYNKHKKSLDIKAPKTPLLYDIAAVQYLYGANNSVGTGNDVYRWDTNQNFAEAIWDAGGNDTIDASNQILSSRINLGAGSFSSIGSIDGKSIVDNLAIAFNVMIENAIGGAGNDEIIGNQANNNIQGKGGNDLLIGGAGSDTFVFRAAEGNDTIRDFNRQEGDKILFDGTAQLNQFRYNAQTGQVFFNDQVLATLANKPTDFSIGTDLVVKDGVNPPVVTPTTVLMGTSGDDVLSSRNNQGDAVHGLDGNDRITGGLGNDTLDGGAGNDILDGGAGNDWLVGGAGNDTFTVDSSQDVITEGINGGNDTVLSWGGYTLADNVENLTLMGDAAVRGNGNSLNNRILGSAIDNYIYAGDGMDQVNGQGGNDYLFGQAGNDYLFGQEGNDWLIGDLGDDVLNGGTGNDRLIGGAGSDILSGEKGADRLTGGADADRFVLKSFNDGVDMITDFDATQGDKILISAKGFGGVFQRGGLSSTQFTLGAAADRQGATFVYNTASGRLFFDRDGIGGQDQIQIAKLVNGTALASNNFQIIA